MKIDFVSDVTCPWCAVGLNSLERALERLGGEVQVELHFQPFELNPAMPPEGEDATEHLARVAVSDQGVGIPQDFLPFVFDRFRQADASSTRAQGGLGLGLAIVRHIIEMHSGSVRVESRGKGQGGGRGSHPVPKTDNCRQEPRRVLSLVT